MTDRQTEQPTKLGREGPSPELKNYYRFYSIRTAGGTNFSFQIPKYKSAGQFQPSYVINFVTMLFTQIIQPVNSVSVFGTTLSNFCANSLLMYIIHSDSKSCKIELSEYLTRNLSAQVG